MKRLITTFNILLLAALSSSFAFADGQPQPKEEWLFIQTADEAQILNNTTIVMPVTRKIFAFTDRPDRKHAYMTGAQFASLWDEGASFKTVPPSAVLTWVEGETVKEAEGVITGARSDGNSITYTHNLVTADARPSGELKTVSLFIDNVSCDSLYCRLSVLFSRFF
jgi:hypothetical protein